MPAALPQFARVTLDKVRWRLNDLYLRYPKRVTCNVCGWEGRRFNSDEWHKYVICRRCRSHVRHRLLAAALSRVEGLTLKDLVDGKRVLHFAPERRTTQLIKPRAGSYRTADFMAPNVDLQLDLTDMPAIPSDSVDLVVACDVLEHVPDHRRGMREIHRVLSPGGWAILTVPQKDGLEQTFEDPTITSPEERERVFGQSDHLRIFGNDVPQLLESAGFRVRVVGADAFPPEVVRRHVLFPPVLSAHPLATNHRKAYFARKP